MERTTISLNAARRLLMKAGLNRVSHEALKATAKLMELRGLEVAKKIKIFTTGSRRKTVRAEDVLFAAKKLWYPNG